MANQTFQRTGIYKDFDLSMGLNPLTKDVSKKSDANSINQSLMTLINTNYYERPFRPGVGSNIRNTLFEPVDPITVIELKSGIMEVINNYEPRVTVIDIDVTDMFEYNAYGIEIVYRINSVFEPQSLKITLKRLR